MSIKRKFVGIPSDSLALAGTFAERHADELADIRTYQVWGPDGSLWGLCVGSKLGGKDGWEAVPVHPDPSKNGFPTLRKAADHLEALAGAR